MRVEPFDNGARVRLVVSQRSDAPDEIQLAVHAEPGSAPLDYCILTATMGNLARTRLLWLKDEVVSSLRLYPDAQRGRLCPAPHLSARPPGAHPVRRRAGGGDHRRRRSRIGLPVSRAASLALRRLQGDAVLEEAARHCPARICTPRSTPATPTGRRAGPYRAAWRSRTSSCASAFTTARPSSSASPARPRRNSGSGTARPRIRRLLCVAGPAEDWNCRRGRLMGRSWRRGAGFPPRLLRGQRRCGRFPRAGFPGSGRASGGRPSSRRLR